jgi:hypothetical protein
VFILLSSVCKDALTLIFCNKRNSKKEKKFFFFLALEILYANLSISAIFLKMAHMTAREKLRKEVSNREKNIN